MVLLATLLEIRPEDFERRGRDYTVTLEYFQIMSHKGVRLFKVRIVNLSYADQAPHVSL